MQFNGGLGNDRIAGTSRADVMLGAGGNDLFVSGAGADIVMGGSGNDRIEAGADNDIAYGGAGNDIMSGGSGDDILLGGAGDDVLGGGIGNDILSGGSGNDVFQFSAAAGGFGNDVITDFAAGDKINLYAGAVGNSRNIEIRSVDDLIALTTGPGALGSAVDAGDGAVRIDFGSFGSITFMNLGSAFGFSGGGNAAGSTGDDLLLGGPGFGSLVGNTGDDIALAGIDGNQMQGGADNDTLVGGAANDTVGGQDGNDILFGNGGNDALFGGAGDDILSGGDGADRFVFQGTFGRDTIADLSFDEGDVLSFVGASVFGNNVQISSLTQLQDLIDDQSLTVAVANGVSTVDLGGGNALTLSGYVLSSGAVVL